MKNAEKIANRFKIRASAAGQLMTNGRASGSMGETCKTYLKNWILEQPELLGVRVNDFSNKYTEKGNFVEADALNYLSEHVYSDAFLVPNTRNFSDDFMTGTPDIIQPDHIADNKASWSASTFPFFGGKLKTKDYFWQGQVYMNLVGREKHIVYYVLMSTPDHLIEREAQNRARKLGFPDVTDELWNDTRKQLTFEHLGPEMRIKPFEFEFDAEKIEELNERVIASRGFIYEILRNL